MKTSNNCRIGFWMLCVAVVLSSCTKTYHLMVEANDPDMGKVFGSGYYAPNTEVEIGAQAFSGYEFVCWNDGNTENPRKVSVSSDITYTAVFEPFNDAPAFEFGEMTDQEGRTYKTVLIGGCWWMAENLAVVKDSIGQNISAQGGEMSHQTPLCYADPNEHVFYNWPAAMSVCPPGWNLPSSVEWEMLEQTLGADPRFCFEGDPSKIAKALANRNNDWKSSQIPGTPGCYKMYNNTSGFAADPNGKYDAEFTDYQYTSNIWLSDALNDTVAQIRTISYDKPDVSSGYHNKNVGFSVRCVRHNQGGGTGPGSGDGGSDNGSGGGGRGSKTKK